MCCSETCILLMVLYVCFFFKQKTAYEMRISDWSSDVCSSDLLSRQCRDDRRVALRTGDARLSAQRPCRRSDDDPRHQGPWRRRQEGSCCRARRVRQDFRITTYLVIPATEGTQGRWSAQLLLGSRFRGNDRKEGKDKLPWQI